MKKSDDKQEIARALGLFTQLGFAMATCIVIGVAAGRFFDQRLGTAPCLLIVGIIVGVISAFKVLYDLVMKEWMK